MHTIADLLDAASVKLKHATDYRLAKELGVANQSVYRWRLGQSLPDNNSLVSLAQLIGINPQYAIACMVIARGGEKNEPYWRAAAEREPESVKIVNQLLKGTAAAYEREAEQLKERARQFRARARARRGAASIVLAGLALAGVGAPAPSRACASTADIERSSLYIMFNRRYHPVTNT